MEELLKKILEELKEMNKKVDRLSNEISDNKDLKQIKESVSSVEDITRSIRNNMSED